jgi:Zn-dependent protease
MLRPATISPLRRQATWLLSNSKRLQASAGLRWNALESQAPRYSQSMRPVTEKSLTTLLASSSRTPLVRSSLHSHPMSLHAGSVSYFSSNLPGGGRGPAGGNRWMRGAGALGTGAVVLFGKGKYLLGALKLTKLASLGSMVLTVGTYSMFFGFPYAAGMVGLITVHEIGHAAVMHQRGIPFSPMVFMPFMGAMISMNRRPRDAWEDALVAFGGPVLGSVGAGAVAVAGHMTESQLLFALADFGFMINLFNLLPLGSMDGGRIAGALSPWAHVAGLGMGTTLAYSGAIHNPLFYLILLAGGWETFQRFYNPGSIPPNYYRITPMQRGAIGLGYVGLVGSLALAMDVNERFKKPPEVLVREREMEQYYDMR